MKEIEIYSCGCQYCEQKLAYCIGTFQQTLKCQCGNTCNHWGIQKTITKHIHINHKLIKYLKWLYLQQNDDKEGFNSALALYREILKTNYTTAIKVTNTIEMMTDKLCHSFTKDDIVKYSKLSDTSFLKKGLDEFLSKKVKFFGFNLDVDIKSFVKVLKPLLYPYMQFVQVLRVLELKRPEVYRFIIADKERLWWFKSCIDEVHKYIDFRPPEYMLSIDEIFGTKFKEETS